MQEVNEDESSKTDEHEGLTNDNGIEPFKKKLRLQDVPSTSASSELIKFQINEKLMEKKFIKVLQHHWKNDLHYLDDQIEFYTKPFKLCVAQNFVQNSKIIDNLVEEIIENIDWSRKEIDLYEFDRSNDLSGMTTKYLKEFFSTLQTVIMPWMEEISGIKLNRVSASCAMYNRGDYLLVHDDLINDRQIAFVFYLSPWESTQKWTPDMGGCLEIFDTITSNLPLSEASSSSSIKTINLPYFPVVRKIPPCNNQFVFFKVGSKSFHQVGEVITSNCMRLTINGWFHGEVNKEATNISSQKLSSLIASMNFQEPINICEFNLANYIEKNYLKKQIIQDIQKQIELNSEISLKDFIIQQKYNKILSDLKKYEKQNWTVKGPANFQNYEILKTDQINGDIENFVNLLCSNEMFHLLHKYTDLDLYGKNAKSPKCYVEIQRWHHGCYTIIDDDSVNEDDTLDLIFYLNAVDNVGVISYLNSANDNDDENVKKLTDDSVDESDSDGDNFQNKFENGSKTIDSDSNESDTSNELIGYVERDDDNDNDNENSVLLTITPKSNYLNIVYRTKGTTKFTKYVSHKNELPDNEFVYIIVASYKE